MKKTLIALAFASLALVGVGCGQGKKESGPVEGTVVKDNMTIEEKIKAVEADPNIPAQYKETYLNSLRAQQQAQAQGGGQGAPR
ncbi:MAG TPA: hypothetical protein VGE01_07290 [Fimbriimonas sp.]